MNESRLPLRVVKVGGSLLDWADLRSALDRWLAGQPAATCILVCGGGPFANAIREADSTFALGEEASHWLCIDALRLSTRLLSAIVPRAKRLSTLVELQSGISTSQPGLIVFDPREFLEMHEPHFPGTPLPHTWQASSDSIAARLAEILAADDLVLLKSADPPEGDLASIAATGYADAHFPVAVRLLPHVRFVNLRTA